MLIKLLSVVGQDDDQGVFVQALSLENVQGFCKQRIRTEDSPVIQGRDQFSVGRDFEVKMPPKLPPFLSKDLQAFLFVNYRGQFLLPAFDKTQPQLLRSFRLGIVANIVVEEDEERTGGRPVTSDDRLKPGIQAFGRNRGIIIKASLQP